MSKKMKRHKYCIDCGKELKNMYAIRCQSCANKRRIVSQKTKDKIRKARKGKKFSPFTQEHKDNLSKALIGNKSPNWIDGRSYKSYPQEFTKALKKQILERDNYTCQGRGCGSKRDLMPHHIDYNKMNCELNNLITLCRSCNGKVNFKRGFWLGWFCAKMGINISWEQLKLWGK